jgi:hypothetical protein
MPYSFTEETLRWQSAVRSEEIRIRKESDQWLADQKAKGEAWAAVLDAEVACRNAKGKEARKEARKALAYAEWVHKTIHDPRYKV